MIDCTGHGVPGAFMTMIMASILEHVLSEERAKDPALMLSIMNQTVKRALNQMSDDLDVLLTGKQQSDDGMDTAFLYFENGNRRLIYAGANTPLFILRPDDSVVEVIKGNAMGVGSTAFDYTWRNRELTLPEGTLVCVTTDGITDQIGGPKNIQFSRGRLREKILSNRSNSIHGLRDSIIEDFRQYQGSQTRRDDISFFGIRL